MYFFKMCFRPTFYDFWPLSLRFRPTLLSFRPLRWCFRPTLITFRSFDYFRLEIWLYFYLLTTYHCWLSTHVVSLFTHRHFPSAHYLLTSIQLLHFRNLIKIFVFDQLSMISDHSHCVFNQLCLVSDHLDDVSNQLCLLSDHLTISGFKFDYIFICWPLIIVGCQLMWCHCSSSSLSVRSLSIDVHSATSLSKFD